MYNVITLTQATSCIVCSDCNYTILVECLALWGEHERNRRLYSSQAAVLKPALFTERSNTDKRRISTDTGILYIYIYIYQRGTEKIHYQLHSSGQI